MDEIKVSLSKEKALNTEIKDINYIPGYKQYELERQQNEIIRQSNETTRQSNETARETYVNELKQRVDSGEFKGEKGDKGEDGKQGPAGPQGEQGETGPTGPQGEQGPKGEQGETGSQGPQGETGAKGEKGDKGDKGDKGEKGDNAIPPKSQNTATGTSIKLEDSSDLDIKSLVLSGKSTQETRSEKNLFDASKISSSTKIVVTDNGKTITMPVMGSGSNGVTTTNVTLSQLAPNLKVGDVVWLNATTTSAANKYIYLMGSGRLWYFGASATIQQKDLDSVVNLYGNRYTDGETEQVVITDFRITKNSTDTWEPYGVMPSPDFPSPIDSVGRKNLFDVTLDSSITSNIQYKTYKLEPNTKYTISTNTYLSNDATANIFIDLGKSLTPSTSTNGVNGSKTIMTDSTGYVTIGYRNVSMQLDYSTGMYYCQLEKGTVATDYVPYEHTEISATVTRKNLVNPNLPVNSKTQNGITITNNGDGTYTATGTSTSSLAISLTQKNTIKLNKSTSYTNSIEILEGNFLGAIVVTVLDSEDKITYNYINVSSSSLSNTKTPTEDLTIKAYEYYIDKANITVNFKFRVQLEEGTVATDYEEYKSNSLTIDLQGNKMCSLPNGVKDEASIENGRAKIIKKVGKLTAEELEIGELILSDPNYILFSTTQLDGIAVSSEEKNSYCNVFQWAESLSSSALTDNNYAIETVESVDKTLLKVSLSKSLLSDYTRNSIKAWLTSNNFVLYYELVTPYEIDLGEVEMPRTYYKVSNISNSANTDMSIEYYTEFKGEKGDKGDKGEKGDDGGVMILAEDDDATKIQKALSCLNSNQTQLVRPLFYRTDNTHSVYPCVQYSESTSGNTFSFMLLMEDELWAMLMTIKNDAITENFITVSLSSMIFPTITGYDATKTQVLKNVNGTLTWVDES